MKKRVLAVILGAVLYIQALMLAIFTTVNLWSMQKQGVLG